MPMKFIFLLLLISCGKEATGKRCFTQEEAMIACEAKEMAEYNIPLETAKLICAPYYQGKACYHL